MDLMHERDVQAFRPAMEPASNFLLAALSPDDAQRLWPYLEHVHLTKGAVLYANGLPPSHAYFPTTAVIALQCGLSDGRAGDFAVIGHEGVVGSPSFTGSDLSLVRAEVRCTGDAFRLHQTLLADAATRPHFALLLLRHTQSLIAQAAQTALCVRQHSISEQLCELLLATLDRLPLPQIAMTHEAIASALGVRREGVTEAALLLQQNGRIRYTRGHIEILDRAALEHDACECYGVSQRLHDSLLPRSMRPNQAGAMLAAPTHGHAARPLGARTAVALAP